MDHIKPLGALSMKRQSGQSIKLLMKLLRQQDNMCYYCCQPFNKKAIYKRKVIILHPVLDHVIPFSYCQHSKHYNFVVTCQICNAWKSNLIFNTFADAAEYLRNKWLGVRQCKKSVKHVNELSKPEKLEVDLELAIRDSVEIVNIYFKFTK